MKYRIPDYYNSFSCIGSQCRDNCCIGWEIDIDEKSFVNYQSIEGSFRKKLSKGISKQPYPHFKMDHLDRCVFLNEQNLCEIYQELGKESLCRVCTEHPRFHAIYGEIKESGLGLACETAAELILKQEEPLKFYEAGEGALEDEMMEFLFEAREEIFHVLQNREISMEKRWNYMYLFTKHIQNILNQGEAFKSLSITELNLEQKQPFQNMKSAAYINLWIGIYKDFEKMDDVWENLLENALQSQENPENMDLENTFYEQLMIYFIYRYFMKSVYDDNPLDKVKFAMISCLLIARIVQCANLSFYGLTAIDAARLYSKEIEYSKENMEAVFEELLFDSI